MEEVTWLDVSVNNSVLMGVSKRLEQRGHITAHVIELHSQVVILEVLMPKIRQDQGDGIIGAHDIQQLNDVMKAPWRSTRWALQV